MSTYVIGDVQGCYEPLLRLLDKVAFDQRSDHLWFVGDLVNRGPDSLNVLRFLRRLPIAPIICLGNHDLHFLARLFTTGGWEGKDDTLAATLRADGAEDLGHWLRRQNILYFSKDWNTVMTHAGVAPMWDALTAQARAQELEAVLSGENFQPFLQQMYGNDPNYWSDSLTGIARLRAITNYFTRMRFCNAKGEMLLRYKGTVEAAPSGHYPWFLTPHRRPLEMEVVFGHWAALNGRCSLKSIHALDTGCVWGGCLTALRLEDKQLFSVDGLSGP